MMTPSDRNSHKCTWAFELAAWKCDSTRPRTDTQRQQLPDVPGQGNIPECVPKNCAEWAGRPLSLMRPSESSQLAPGGHVRPRDESREPSLQRVEGKPSSCRVRAQR